eukprot:13999178-Heterocapsa_arctica.AAC.1
MDDFGVGTGQVQAAGPEGASPPADEDDVPAAPLGPGARDRQGDLRGHAVRAEEVRLRAAPGQAAGHGGRRRMDRAGRGE